MAYDPSDPNPNPSDPNPSLSDPNASRTTHLLTLSASTPDALTTTARDTAAHLATLGDASPAPLCSRAAGGPHSGHRLGVVGRTAGELAERIGAHLAGEPVREVFVGHADPARRPPVAFLFSGQGAQYAGMAQGLHRTEPVFRDAFDRCAEAARPFVAVPLQELLDPGAGPSVVYRLAHAALGTFCVNIALAELWRSWGVEPAAVLGFSSGEYAAACWAGILAPEDAVRLLGTQVTLAERVTDGAMAVVALGEEDALQLLAEAEPSVGLAAVISPGEVSLSGRATTLARIVDRLTASGVRTSSLPVSSGLHSPLQEPALAELRAVAATIPTGPPRIPFVSTVTGTGVTGPLAPEHWCRQLRGPVRFLDAVRALDELGVRAHVEVGPGRALVGLGARCLPGGERMWLASLGRSTDGTAPMLMALGRLHTAGVPVSWNRVYPGSRSAV
ncbi:acyltransferase domain-containing protein [Streptomyces sp. NBC_01373]|uniref:acyltransferase domain-containing protein n=1 Tax=Streptomyces sp. NBC_01373 TaxID=2903843 RepID=UPI00224E1FF4|nr:acyltransferase domain-containing protein [Streptomyces sp. NBC_01373]MCX4700866.1 acyltransferase domain-containing protein [Streptomyces sp. NBC_01373]